MSALDDPRIARLFEVAQLMARRTEPEAWHTHCVVLVDPSAAGVHAHVVSEGADVMPDGTAIMVSDASRLAAAGVKVDGTPYAMLCAGKSNVVLALDVPRLRAIDGGRR